MEGEELPDGGAGGEERGADDGDDGAEAWGWGVGVTSGGF